MPAIQFNATEAEALTLNSLSADTSLSHERILRQALRLYQAVHIRAQAGERLAFTSDGKTVIPPSLSKPLLG